MPRRKKYTEKWETLDGYQGAAQHAVRLTRIYLVIGTYKNIVVRHAMWTDGNRPSKAEQKKFYTTFSGPTNHLKYYRNQSRSLRVESQLCGIRKIGGVYEKGGAFMNRELVKQIKKEKILNPKKPKSLVKHIGIEFECVVPLDHEPLIEKIIEHKLEDVLSVGTDNSVNGILASEHNPDCSRYETRCDCGYYDFRGAGKPAYSWEIRALFQQKNFKSTLKRVCDFFASIKAITNISCGMHVHLDIRKRDSKKVAHNLILSQRILFSLVPKSRRSREYCQPNFKLYEPGRGGRGAVHYDIRKHGTIEVRVHHGCLNFQKIYAWVRLLIAIADAPKLSEPINTINQLRRSLPLSPEQRLYLLKRIKKFGGVSKMHLPSTTKEWTRKFPPPPIPLPKNESALFGIPSSNMYVPLQINPIDDNQRTGTDDSDPF